MRKMTIIHISIVALLLLCLFLPHLKYDLYQGGFFSNRTLIRKGVVESGFKNIYSYVPVFFAVLCCVLVNVYRVVGTAIAGLVLMALTLLYMPIEGFSLVFDLFGPKSNQTLEIGYFLKVLLVAGYLAFMIVELVLRVRERRRTRKNVQTNVDLLDDF